MKVNKLSYFLWVSMFASCSTLSLSAPVLPSQELPAALQNKSISFKKIIHYSDSINLSGVSNEETLQFVLRKDQIVKNSSIHLEYIPSPSLLPTLSQVMVYFNDDLVGVYPITQDQMGKKVIQNIAVDPMTVTTQNRIRFKFIGHYTDICENTLHSSLWLKVLRTSSFDLSMIDLPLQNDLSFLPLPFIDDANENNGINMVFAQAPNPKIQQAASVVASWFSVKTNNKITFNSKYKELPQDNAIVFVTNQNIPSFLNTNRKVTKPTIEIINHPTVSNKKILVLWGRDDKDLTDLAKAFATNNMQLSGAQASLNKLAETGSRQPYDAPNWLPVNKPLTLGQVKTYAEQLTTTGFKLNPMSLYLRLPPDLFALGTYSTAFDLKYRYTNPVKTDDSRVLMYINNQFYKSLQLGSSKEDSNSTSLQLPIHQGVYTDNQAFKMPGIMPDRINEIRFEPYFMSVTPGGSKDQCVTYQPVANALTIDDDSVIDFTKFAHYMKMPNLHAFVYSGFPFSKMADLSETLVVSPQNPTEQQTDLIINTISIMSSKIGLPAYNVNFADKDTDVSHQDKDILLFENYSNQGGKPKFASQDFQLKGTVNELNLPLEKIVNQHAKSLVNVTTNGSIGAMIGYESENYKKRSIVAFLSNDSQSLKNLSQIIQEPEQTDIFGGLVIVRPSGITSIILDNEYSVGSLNLFQRMQIFVSKNIWLSAIIAILVLLVSSFLVALKLKSYRKNRVNHDR